MFVVIRLTVILAALAILASSDATNQTLTNLTVLISASTTSCTPPSVLVTDPRAAWNSGETPRLPGIHPHPHASLIKCLLFTDLNAGAGGKYVNLCATYDTEADSGIVSVQAAGLTSKYKPNCDFSAGYTPLAGSIHHFRCQLRTCSHCAAREPQ